MNEHQVSCLQGDHYFSIYSYVESSRGTSRPIYFYNLNGNLFSVQVWTVTGGSIYSLSQFDWKFYA